MFGAGMSQYISDLQAELAEHKLLADTYMEVAAAIMKQQGLDEIEIDPENLPNKPFSVWRKVEDGRLIVRLCWDDQPARAS